MGPEPLEWLHVSLINTATALDTVCLINIRATRERQAEGGKRRDRRKVHEKQNWQEQVAKEQLVSERREDKQKERLPERREATA